MNHFLRIFTISLFVINIQAQATKGYDLGSNGVQSDSRILDMFENIKNSANSATKAIVP